MSKPDSSEKPGPLAVDLDGTLAQPLEPFHISKVGDPYPAMLQRVKDEIASGRKVSIFTARAAGDDVAKIDPVRNWLEKHGLPRDMEITAVKDPKFAEFWDDRARQAKDGDLAEKMAASDDMEVYHHVPTSAVDAVLKHGLLSSEALAANPELLALARPDPKEREEWLARLQKEKDWPHRKGPNVLFKEAPADLVLPDNHPTKQTPHTRVKVRLGALLRDKPDTKVYGMELAPFDEVFADIDDDKWNSMSPDAQNALREKRKRMLSAEELKALTSSASSELWKHYKDPGKPMYAPDVPHAAIITSDGVIPPEYLDVQDALQKQAAMVVRKKRIEEHLDEHCPHCDTKFVEKGGPRLEGDMSSGEYDWVCRKCNGIVEYPEMSDEYIDNYTGFGGEDMKDILRTQRDKRRQYLARRSSEGARNNAQQGGGEKQAYTTSERLIRLRERRGECPECGRPLLNTGCPEHERPPILLDENTKRASVCGFHRPENYDRVSRVGDLGIYSGQNDWEAAPTWAWVVDADEASATAELVWVNIKYPGGYDPGDDGKNTLTQDRAMRDLGKKFVRDWQEAAVAIYRKRFPEATRNHPSLSDFTEALKTDSRLTRMVKAHGATRSEPRDKQASALLPDEPPRTGPMAILHRLKTLDLKALEEKARADIASGKVTRRDRGVKMLNAIAGLKRNNLQPADLMITKVPVIPPAFRPFSVAGGTYIPGAANELYQDLLRHRDLHRDTLRTFGPSGADLTRRNMYAAIKAVSGYGEPVSRKVRDRAPKGFLEQITGSNPKLSFPQAKMLAKPVDNVMRATITINPDLDMDEISLPRERVWNDAGSHVQRLLVQRGMPMIDAIRAVKERTRDAEIAMQDYLRENPVFYSRAPAWHRFSAVGGYVKMHDGDNIAINPYVTAGLNADFDGDQINVHFPVLPQTVKEVKEKLMPSKTLFSIRNQDQVMALPKHEAVLGLFAPQQRPAQQVHQFNSREEAVAAIERGDVSLSDEIEIPDEI